VRPGGSFQELIENIDIGGPSMIRSAAKNFADVAVVVSPDDYGWILEEMQKGKGCLSLGSQFLLAQKAFSLTAAYEAAISSYLSRVKYTEDVFRATEEVFPGRLYISLEKVGDLRYGENPHQRAAFYEEVSSFDAVLPDSVQLQGKELSFNNIIDLNAAYQLSQDLWDCCAVVVKHTNPCGVAISRESQVEAYVKARACDPVAAFGCVLGFNRILEKETAQEVALTFVEAIMAPDYSPDALNLLSSKRNLRLLRYSEALKHLHPWDYKRIEGGMLIQDVDRIELGERDWKVVTKRNPNQDEWGALKFAWQVVKHVKSNAIVYSNETQTVGI